MAVRETGVCRIPVTIAFACVLAVFACAGVCEAEWTVESTIDLSWRNDESKLSAAIDGDIAVIADNQRAVVYQWNSPGAWTQVAELSAAEPAFVSYLPMPVALEGTTVVASPWWEGRVTVLEPEAGGTWGQTDLTVVLDPAYPPISPPVGIADMAVGGDTILVASVFPDWIAPECQGVYVFERSADGSWRYEGKLPFTGYDPRGGCAYTGPLAMYGDQAILIWRNPDPYMGFPYAAPLFERDASNTWQENGYLDVPVNRTSYIGPIFNSLTGDVAFEGGRAILASSRAETWIYELQADGSWLRVAELDGGDSVGIEGDFAVVAGPDWLNWPENAVRLLARDDTGAWSVAQVLLDSADAAIAMGGGRILVVDPDSAMGYVYIPEPASALLLAAGAVAFLRRRSSRCAHEAS